jgi:hypothetical protein
MARIERSEAKLGSSKRKALDPFGQLQSNEDIDRTVPVGPNGVEDDRMQRARRIFDC